MPQKSETTPRNKEAEKVIKLAQLMKDVDDWREYFEDNVKRYNFFKKFVFKTSMDETEIATLQSIGKPTIEFNILESYLSRLRGEFAKQQPSLVVRAADGISVDMLTSQFIQTIEVLEGHLKADFFDGENDMLQYDVYTDEISGGYSVIKVATEYVCETSFEQNINIDRVFDPTLCGFSPLARKSHKGDGRYCFEIYPMTKEKFESDFGIEYTKTMKFSRNISGFSWSYKGENEDIILVCDQYEKSFKDIQLVKLSNGHSVEKKQYKEFLKAWNQSGELGMPPEIVQERKSTKTVITRFRFCEGGILDEKETNFGHLPLIFVDGNSVMLTRGETSYQMTRPSVYHAKGIQRLKNFAGQSLANELENTMQSKIIAAIESVPSDYLETYQNYQKASTLLYNHFLDTNNPEVTLPPPREIVRPPIPPQIADTFRMSDEMTQAILGSYDGAAGIAKAQLSGIAFARSAMQSNITSMPYIIGYIKAISRAATVKLHLIPKYYRTPRTLPVLQPDGKRSYIEINKKGSLYMNFDANNLQVKIEVGVNFAMQKEIALQTLIAIMQASPTFSEFMNEKGLQILLDNIDIRGIEGLQLKVEEYEKMKAQESQQKQQMQQMQLQTQMQQQQLQVAEAKKVVQSPTREQVEMMKLKQDSAIDGANLSIKEKDSETKFLDVMSKIRQQDAEVELRRAEVDAENTRSIVEMAVKASQVEDKE